MEQAQRTGPGWHLEPGDPSFLEQGTLQARQWLDVNQRRASRGRRIPAQGEKHTQCALCRALLQPLCAEQGTQSTPEALPGEGNLC